MYDLNSTSRMFEGTLIEVSGGGAVIELNGRLGQLKIPLRMLISDESPRVGQKVRFMMTYPEVINEGKMKQNEAK